MSDRYRMFMVAGNRLAAAAEATRVEAFPGFNPRVYDHYGAAVAAFGAAGRSIGQTGATPAPAPRINPAHYPDPISYLNRCRHFKRVEILMERGADGLVEDGGDWRGYASSRLDSYLSAKRAYAVSVERAMSLNLPYPPFARQDDDGNFPF